MVSGGSVIGIVGAGERCVVAVEDVLGPVCLVDGYVEMEVVVVESAPVDPDAEFEQQLFSLQAGPVRAAVDGEADERAMEALAGLAW